MDSIPGLLFIIFIMVAITVCVLGSTKQFHAVTTMKTWQQARDYCRTHHTDLATIRTQEEADLLTSSTSVTWGWIGLHRDPTNMTLWRWTELGEAHLLTSSDNSQWVNQVEPQNINCTFMFQNNRKWYSGHCYYRRYFLCDDGDTVHLVRESRTWERAQQYCEENYRSLATISQEDMLLDQGSGYYVWIGLFRDGDDVWKWAGGNQTDFRNWAGGHPDNQDCGALLRTSTTNELRWTSSHCYYNKPFTCYEEKLILVKENKTWEEALEFCRSLTVDLIVDPTAYNNHLYDLASLSDDNHLHANEKIQAATTDQVWTGLRFLAARWLWVNGDQLQYQDLPFCPAQWQHCGTLPKDGATPWEVRDCQERRNFLCFKRGLA